MPRYTGIPNFYFYNCDGLIGGQRISVEIRAAWGVRSFERQKDGILRKGDVIKHEITSPMYSVCLYSVCTRHTLYILR